MTTYCSVVLGGGQGGRVRGSGVWWVMRYPSIVIPSEARNLCHLRSSGRYQGIPNEKPAYPQTFGHRHYLYSAALLYSDAPHRHFAFLISHSSKAFIPSQGGSTPHRLALNPEPFPSIQNPAGVTPTGSFPIILLPFSRCGVPYTPRVWHRGSRDVRSISSSQKR